MAGHTDCPKAPDLNAFERQFMANSDAHDLIIALCRFADHLCGSIPTAGETSETPGAGDGFVGGVSREADRLLSRVSEGRAALRRIERAFPSFGDSVDPRTVGASSYGYGT